MTRTIAIVALGAVLSLACGDDDPAPARRPSERAAERSFEGIAGGVGWEADAPLIERRTTHEMRNTEYVVEGHPDAVLAVSHFGREQGGGGAVRPNVDRWLMQVRPGNVEPRVQRREVNGLFVTVVDARGAYVEMRGETGGAPRVGWRLLGAIAEGPEGLVFFKLTGPEAAVDAAESAFAALVESIHRL